MKTIQLTNSDKTTIIDDADYELINKYKWRLHSSGYVVSGRYGLRLHRLIMNTPEGLFVDHIDGNKLNNTRTNLRNCTNAQNACNRGKNKNNTTGLKGVCYYSHRKSNPYLAQIKYNNKQIYIGIFPTAKAAAEAYNKKAIELFGEFAYLNK